MQTSQTILFHHDAMQQHTNTRITDKIHLSSAWMQWDSYLSQYITNKNYIWNSFTQNTYVYLYDCSINHGGYG